MKHIHTLVILVGVVLAVALVLWWSMGRSPEPGDIDQDLRDAGVLQEDGTITADGEFDAELNALQEELDDVARDADGEMESIETIP